MASCVSNLLLLSFFNVIVILHVCFGFVNASWTYQYCKGTVCLFYNGTNFQVDSNKKANEICQSSRYKLLEIDTQETQSAVSEALIKWENSMRPLVGYYFRINLEFVIGSWTWLDNRRNDVYQGLNLSPYFALVVSNSSGVFYVNEFEREVHPFICSYPGTCGTTGATFKDDKLGFCIVVSNSSKNWFEARSECLKLGGDLVSMSSDASWIYKVAENIKYWVGLLKAKYIWNSAGNLVSYSNWGSGEPIQGHDCTYVSISAADASSYWHKGPCIDSHPFICMNGSDIPSPNPTSSSKVTTTIISTINKTQSSPILPSSPSFATTPVSQGDTTATNQQSTTSNFKVTESKTTDPKSLTNLDTGIAVGFGVLGGILIVLIAVGIYFFRRNPKKPSTTNLYDQTIEQPDESSLCEGPQETYYVDVEKSTNPNINYKDEPLNILENLNSVYENPDYAVIL